MESEFQSWPNSALMDGFKCVFVTVHTFVLSCVKYHNEFHRVNTVL